MTDFCASVTVHLGPGPTKVDVSFRFGDATSVSPENILLTTVRHETGDLLSGLAATEIDRVKQAVVDYWGEGR